MDCHPVGCCEEHFGSLTAFDSAQTKLPAVPDDLSQKKDTLMQASQNAMRSGWGQSCHGTNFHVSWWNTLKAIFTGKRLLYCESHLHIPDHPLPLHGEKRGPVHKGGYGLDEMHGFWSDEAGECFWKTSVTKAYVCAHPQCIAWAKRRNKEHEEFYASEENRKELSSVMSQIGRMPNTNYEIP
jgi:hypothetical protein